MLVERTCTRCDQSFLNRDDSYGKKSSVDILCQECFARAIKEIIACIRKNQGQEVGAKKYER